MSKYDVKEPSALKFLNADGAVVDENGNVVNEASDYWKKVYEQAEPKVAKYLHADGTIDENPGSGGGADLEDNKEVTITENGTVEITPSEGKDGMKKVTATVNVKCFGWKTGDGKLMYTNFGRAPSGAELDNKYYFLPESNSKPVTSEFNPSEYIKISNISFAVAEGTFNRSASDDWVLWELEI